MSGILMLSPYCDARRKMMKIIARLRHNLFVFVTNRGLGATNHRAEGAPRPCAIHRKITNGFRSQSAATVYADMRSAVETGRRRRVRAIDAIGVTLAVTIVSIPARIHISTLQQLRMRP